MLVVFRAVAVVFVTAAIGGCFDAGIGGGAVIRCATQADCIDARVCVFERCVEAAPACVVVNDGVSEARADGSACGNGLVCVAAACVPPRCGDGVVEAGEECDDGAGGEGGNDDARADACRTTCKLPSCGDGVADRGEACDGEACVADCSRAIVCGDGVVDDGEVCDDANGCARDGCDACRKQTWDQELLVSGAVEGRQARGVALLRPSAVAADTLGRVFVADETCSVRRVDFDGTVTTVAGTGVCPERFVGGALDAPATTVALNGGLALAVDALGNLAISDGRTGIVGADGVLRAVPALDGAGMLAFDARGRLHAVTSAQIVRLEDDGTVTVVAGTGTDGFSGDGGPAVAATIGFDIRGLAIDARGRVFFSDSLTRVRRIDENGTIATVAGNGTTGSIGAPNGDGGPAVSATLPFANDVAVDALGRLYINELFAIRRVDIDGVIATITGGDNGFSGDGGPIGAAQIGSISSLAVDGAGRLVFSDSTDQRVRRVGIDGIVDTIVGTGAVGFGGDGGPAKSARLEEIDAVTVDPRGGFVFSEAAGQLRRVDDDGFIATLTGARGFLSCSEDDDGGPAIDATIGEVFGIAIDTDGRVLFADATCEHVRVIDLDGTIRRVAGGGSVDADGIPAVDATLDDPRDIVFDDDGGLVIAEEGAGRIRRIDADGIIHTLAGTGAFASAPDGSPAATSPLATPSALAFDDDGRLLFTEEGAGLVRRIEADGSLSTVIGGGATRPTVDGVAARAVRLDRPSNLAVDARGRIVLVDFGVHRVFRLDEDGLVRAIAGTGVDGHSGDGGPALDAQLCFPIEVAIDDADGAILFGDASFQHVRRIAADGTIDSVAGTVDPAGPGRLDRARLYGADAMVAVFGALFVVDRGSGRVVRVEKSSDRVDVVLGNDNAPGATDRAAFSPLLAGAKGIAFDADARTLVVTESQTSQLRIVTLDTDGDGAIDEPGRWTARASRIDVGGPAGIAFDAARGDFVVVAEDDHCVVRVARDGAVGDTVAGTCGARGAFSGLLNGPTHVAIAPGSGAVYVSDTGNARVVRVDDSGRVDPVVGDGSRSSAGEGAPARLFPVDTPGQLAVDAGGNLYVASRSTVRVVANTDGDEDADGDDRVLTIYGGGERAVFPESDSDCLRALTVDGDVVSVADACQGFVVTLTAQTN